MFVVEGDIRARFAHIAHRTSPALGGASVLRESMDVPPDIYDSSVRLVTAIGLQGLCEVEYRRDSAGRPLLMEINARIAGTIEIALRSGVDFPLIVWLWATGHQSLGSTVIGSGSGPAGSAATCAGCATTSDESGRPDSVSRARALWMFVSEFARTRLRLLRLARPPPVMAELRTTVAAVVNSGHPSPTAKCRPKGRWRCQLTRFSLSAPGHSGCRSPLICARLASTTASSAVRWTRGVPTCRSACG